MRIALSIILLLHGGIHLMGFAKAFQFAKINQLSQNISKPIGILWLLVSIVFIISSLLFLLKKEWWFVIAIVAVIISQILIIMYWQDAKFGTIANIIILLVGIVGLGHYQFNKMVRTESTQLLQNIQVKNLPVISNEAIGHLPDIVQKWMQNSGVMGREKIVTVRLKQKGEIKTKPEGKWMPFTATQYFNVENPAFVWSTEVDFMSIIKMVGRDKFMNGQGEMLIKLANIIPIVDEGNNEKINQGVMIRFLSEICWFPSAALHNYIKWEAIDKTSAKAILTYKSESVSGVFKFNRNGELLVFEADRYYGGSKDAKLEKWVISITNYKTFEGAKIPSKCDVTWKLKEGDFNWLNLEITDLEYNTNEHYE